MFNSCTRDLGVLIFVVSKQVHVQKNKVAKLHVGLVSFYSSYDWQRPYPPPGGKELRDDWQLV